MVGGGIEGASQEMIKLGPEDSPRFERKYTLDQLLDPAFRLPVEDEQTSPDIAHLRGLAGVIVD